MLIMNGLSLQLSMKEMLLNHKFLKLKQYKQ